MGGAAQVVMDEPTQTSVSLVIPEEFIRLVVSLVRSGDGIVPFVGSGISAQSGILMGVEFTEYLSFCIWRSVVPGEDGSLLNIRNEGWPVTPTQDQIGLVIRWVADMYTALCKQHGVVVTFQRDSTNVQTLLFNEGDMANKVVSALRRPLVPALLRDHHTDVNDDDARELLRAVGLSPTAQATPTLLTASPTSGEYVCEAALRSLHDWRTMLCFLARLEYPPKLAHPVLGEVDQSVVDRFNSHITTGRRPNLLHNMFCHLAVRTRTRLVLTTNFDTLIEQAFSSLKEAFEVIPVSLKDPLPAPDTVHAQNSIIKLHGSRTETRADLSLDEMPPHDDLKRFFHYVRGRYPEDASAVPSLNPCHLMVCGYSGRDMRCVQMIKYLLDHDTEVKIFWISFSKASVREVERLFTEKSYRGRVIVVRTARPDLLLYEMYQKLVLSLPRGGINYQFSHSTPATPFGESYDPDVIPVPEQKCPGIGALRKLVDEAWNPQAEHVPVIVADGQHGVTAPVRDLFREKTGGGSLRGIWLELEDFHDVNECADELLQILSLNRGRYQLDHTAFPKGVELASTEIPSDWRARWKTILQDWGVEPKYSMLVFHARNGPGGCSGWRGRYWDSAPDQQGVDTFLQLHNFLDLLAELGFRVLYAPYSLERWRRDRRKQHDLEEIMRNQPPPDRPENVSENEPTGDNPWMAREGSRGVWHESRIQKVQDDIDRRVKGDEHGTRGGPAWYRGGPFGLNQSQAEFKSMMGDIFGWLQISAENAPAAGCTPEDSRARQEFLQAWVLFRQSRHFAALISGAGNPCPEPFNIHGIDNDVSRQRQVDKWLQDLTRYQCILRKAGGYAWMHRDMRSGILTLLNTRPGLKSSRCRNHWRLAGWYARAFHTTAHATPLFESLHHYFKAAVYAPDYDPGNQVVPDICDTLGARLRWWRMAVLAMIKQLRQGHRGIVFWMPGTLSNAWLGVVARGDVRRALEEAWLRIVPETERQGPKPDDASRDLLNLLDLEMLNASNLALNRASFSHAYQSAFPVSTFQFLKQGLPCNSGDSRVVASDKGLHQESDVEWLEDLKKDAIAKLIEGLHETEVIKSLFDVLKNALGEESMDAAIGKWRNESFLWLTKVGNAQAHTQLGPLMLLECLTELAYAHVRRAKLEDICREVRETKTARKWAMVCMLCRTSLELASHLHPFFQAQEAAQRIKALTLYGLALGSLNRFTEAHRRLNEANALLSKTDLGRESVEFAIIKLRRAEVHLLEAKLVAQVHEALSKEGKEGFSAGGAFDVNKWIFKVISDSDDESASKAMDQIRQLYLGIETAEGVTKTVETNDILTRLLNLHYAKLDEAWLSLENAERFLSGQTHASLWWTQLYVLQTRVFAEHHPKWLKEGGQRVVRTMPCRVRRGRVQQVADLFRRGMGCGTQTECMMDVFWMTRQIEYSVRAFATAWLMEQFTSRSQDETCFVNCLFEALQQFGPAPEAVKNPALEGLFRQHYQKVVGKAALPFYPSELTLQPWFRRALQEALKLWGLPVTEPLKPG